MATPCIQERKIAEIIVSKRVLLFKKKHRGIEHFMHCTLVNSLQFIILHRCLFIECSRQWSILSNLIPFGGSFPQAIFDCFPIVSSALHGLSLCSDFTCPCTHKVSANCNLKVTSFIGFSLLHCCLYTLLYSNQALIIVRSNKC